MDRDFFLGASHMQVTSCKAVDAALKRIGSYTNT